MTYMVGIAGGSGSGKGTIAGFIKKHLEAWGLSCHILATDNFYQDLSDLDDSERDELCRNPDLNFDHPLLVDFHKMESCAERLRGGDAFEYPEYDFKTHKYDESKVTVVPGWFDVGIVEGLYALYNGPEVQNRMLDLYDYKLFVTTDPGIAQNRRIRRDREERGREYEHILEQLDTTVIPMQQKFIFPTSLNADDIIDWHVKERDKELETKKLVNLARQKAIMIYEQVRGELLPALPLEEIKINGI